MEYERGGKNKCNKLQNKIMKNISLYDFKFNIVAFGYSTVGVLKLQVHWLIQWSPEHDPYVVLVRSSRRTAKI